MTDNHREDYAKEAAQDGRAARKAGKVINPHPMGTLEYGAWYDAWWGSCEDDDKFIKRLHTTHPPVDTVTGRFSSKDVNKSNPPMKEDLYSKAHGLLKEKYHGTITGRFSGSWTSEDAGKSNIPKEEKK